MVFSRFYIVFLLFAIGYLDRSGLKCPLQDFNRIHLKLKKQDYK